MKANEHLKGVIAAFSVLAVAVVGLPAVYVYRSAHSPEKGVDAQAMTDVASQKDLAEALKDPARREQAIRSMGERRDAATEETPAKYEPTSRASIALDLVRLATGWGRIVGHSGAYYNSIAFGRAERLARHTQDDKYAAQLKKDKNFKPDPEPTPVDVVATAPASESFFVVMTLQEGDAPEVVVGTGSGLDAVVRVGQRRIRFDGEHARIEGR